MGNYQGIAIGISRYHFFKSLPYAEADAQSFSQFLIEEAKIPSQQSLLLTDTSPWVHDRSTYPIRENLIDWLNLKNSLSSPLLWFFFSGCAVNYQGEDYLMPIDGNPRDISGTGIAMRSLLEFLQQQNAEQILVILDLKAMGEMKVGHKAIALAKQMKIPLILSCQTHRFSDESSSESHGIFTIALLEALRYYRQKTTLAKLEQYLRDRLPEFSLALYQPTRILTVISPSQEVSNLSLFVPFKSHAQKQRVEQLPVISYQLSVTSYQKAEGRGQRAEGRGAEEQRSRGAEEQRSRGAEEQRSRGAGGKIITNYELRITNYELPVTNHQSPVTNQQTHSFFRKIIQFKWFILGLGCSLFPSLLLVILVFQLLPIKERSEILTIDTSSQKSSTIANSIEQDILNRAKTFLKTNQASDFNKAIGAARQLQPEAFFEQDAQADIDRWSQIILDIAQGRAQMGDFSRAIAAAKLVPRDRVILYETARQKIQLWEGLQAQQQANQVLIAQAKALINPSQASTYNQAIALLRQIPPEHPGYLEARQFINNWSQKIYFLAISRAAKGNIKQAIETAKLIPLDSPLYEDVQRAIAKWQQQIENRK
jgi:hypothetical protein